MTKGYLFDLDGVILDSEDQYTAFWEEIERIYPTGIPDYAHYIKGNNLPRILAYYPTEEIRTDILRRIDLFDQHLQYHLFPGAIELLRALSRADIPRALYTSSEPMKLQRLFAALPELQTLFDAIIDGSMVSHGKPDPEGYIMAARALGLDPRDCTVVEDSIQGIRAGRAAGCSVIGIATTNPASLLLQETPTVIPSISSLQAP